MTEDTKLWFACTWGGKSHLNLLGKIVFTPVIIIVGVVWIVCDLLFSKRETKQ